MNFKKIAVAAALAIAAGSSFAADIVMVNSGSINDIATIATAADLFIDSADITNALAVSQAIIIQAGEGQIAYIEQVGTTFNFASIFQGADSAGAIAAIVQSGSNSRAVINQK